MKHINIVTKGTFIGLRDGLVVLKSKQEIIKEWPLKRIRSIKIAQSGISLSTNFLSECAQFGIQVYIIDFRGRPLSQISGVNQHAVAELRKHQIITQMSTYRATIGAKFIEGKIKNQRAVLLYYKKANTIKADFTEVAIVLKKSVDRVRSIIWEKQPNWQQTLMGIEGNAAKVYWNFIKENNLLTNQFQERTGYNATDLVNQCLNLGYAVLTSFVWSAVSQAGLEPYIGMIHSNRPGKPSLILDIMEEYRAWTVDRILIKMRNILEKYKSLTPELKQMIISKINAVWQKSYPYHKKRVKLEAILQRQVYKLCSEFYREKKYKPYIFKW